MVRGLVARMRVRAELVGRADHSGTTPPEERKDALAAAARLIVAALDEAGDGLRVTASRIEVEPNALTTVPARARVWMDARSPEDHRLAAWRDRLGEVAEGLDVGATLSVESHSPACEFDPALRARLAELGGGAPELDCCGRPRRRPAGAARARRDGVRAQRDRVSHSPEERVELEDAAYGTELLLRLVEEPAA